MEVMKSRTFKGKSYRGVFAEDGWNRHNIAISSDKKMVVEKFETIELSPFQSYAMAVRKPGSDAFALFVCRTDSRNPIQIGTAKNWALAKSALQLFEYSARCQKLNANLISLRLPMFGKAAAINDETSNDWQRVFTECLTDNYESISADAKRREELFDRFRRERVECRFAESTL